MNQHIVRMLVVCMAVLCGVGRAWADEWSIVFSEIGDRNHLADKDPAVISAEVANGMGTVTLGEALNPNFGIQTETTWLYRTAQKALYQGNGGGRNFGVFNAIAKQIITLDISAAPTPTNATLKSTNGNVRVYEVTADGTVTFNLARYNYIYSISVANPSATDVDYTLRYVDEHGTELKIATKSGTPGESVSLLDTDKENFWIEENKYLYVSDDAAGKTIAADGSTVVTLIYRQATIRYSYTVKSNVGDNVFANASVLETESVTVPYPEHVLIESTLYTVPQEKMTSGDYYRVTFTPDHDNYEVIVPYDGAQIRNVVFYTEGEDIEGVSKASNDVRASKGQMGYTANADTYLPVTTIRQGIYQIYIRGVNGNSAARTVNFKEGDRIVYTDQIPNGTDIRRNSGDVYIGETTTLSFACEGSSASGLDNMYIVRIGDFEPTPVYTLNLRANNGAIANVPKTLSVRAENTDTYTWYESTTVDGAGTVAQSAMTAAEGGNRFTFTRETNAPITYFYCVATGFSGVEKKSVVAEVVTVNESVTGAFVDGYVQNYESGATVDWNTQNAAVAIESHDGSNMIGINGETANGPRTAYLPLTENLKYMTPDHVTNDWGLEFDFYSVAMDFTPTQQALQIYPENATISVNEPMTNPDCFVSFVCDNTSHQYKVYIAGTETETISLDPSVKYHVGVQVVVDTNAGSNTATLTVSVTDANGNTVYSHEQASPFADDVLLGGIMYVLPRRNNKTAHAYFDNITLKVMTTDLAVETDLADVYEGDDDMYLNDGVGLNFDVPAATTFEWYYSSVAPSKEANGTNAPKLNEDGSITWTGHAAFMTVTSPVGRENTAIAATQGVALSTSGKNAVEPTEENDGKYAWGLQQTYGNVQTVWDEATLVNVNGQNIYRYYPEATASGSRWHYLRQLDSDTEDDHTDYVWCVASNALGKVTSKVTQINIYPQAPLIYLLDDYQHMDADGDRYDMTLPANYTFRNEQVKINANNLIFNTAAKPVPHPTVSYIQYLDENQATYNTSDYPFTATGSEWKHEATVWNGVLSTTQFTGLDGLLDAHSSVHGYYKSFGATDTGIQIDFTYGLRQVFMDESYHDITKDKDGNNVMPHGGAQYVIGVDGESSLQGRQTFYCDYGRYPATELVSTGEKTTWDWSKLPERAFLTYNITKYATPEAQAKYLHKLTLHKSDGTVNRQETYVVDPETGLGGPVMGEEYIMADFYGYKPGELGGFPSDKVILGLEYVNEPTDKCMQGNAFIFRPTEEGTLKVTFSSADDTERYLALCTRDELQGAESVVQGYDASKSSDNADRQTVTMDITSDMKDKFVVVRARNVGGDNTNQYFRIYTATYTPDTKPVTAREYIAEDKVDIQGADTYAVVETPAFDANGMGNTDGFISLHAEEGAKIKYKVYVGNATVDDITTAINSSVSSPLKEEIDALETLDYNPEVYTDSVVVDGVKTVRNKIGIHVRVNSTIIAWAETPNMNNSQTLVYATHAATYPVDLRFMYNFTEKPEPSDDQAVIEAFFNDNYWGTGDTAKERESTNAPKAWNAPEYADVEIDGMPYTEENFEKFYITHGTVIDINVMAKEGYQFDGFGAPTVGKVGGDGADKDLYTINDMMRARAATKYARYHLLYDKAKAKNTQYIAFLIANFKDLEGNFTAQIVMKEGTDAATDPTYTSNVIVDDDNRIVAPLYHSAHDADGQTVVMWTEDHSARDANHIMTSADNEIYTSYLPGDVTKIYENTYIKPVYRDNTYLDNYLGRTRTMDAEWWFTTDHKAQSLGVRNEIPGLVIPYVTPVMRSTIGLVAEGSEDDIHFDLPMSITLGTSSRIENYVSSDWCTVSRGIKFTVPVCNGTAVTMEVRSRLSLAAGGTTFGGEFPELWKVKYKGDADYTETSAPDAGKTVESYIYKYVYTGDGETCDIVLGNDYSYLRRIGVSMPVITSNRDAALITLDFGELTEHLDLMSLAGYDNFSPKPAPKSYGEGMTGDGYEFDHKSEGKSLYRTHYSKEDGAIYYAGVSRFMAGIEVPADVPYVNGVSGYTYSTEAGGTFIVGPFRSITHIRYRQGSSDLSGGGWTMKVGRKQLDLPKDQIQTNKTGNINEPDDPRRKYSVSDFDDVVWSDPKAGSISNSKTPVWVEMDIEENIGVDQINTEGYDQLQGDIFLKFEADKPNVYLFAMEIYGIDPTSDQQVTLETGLLAADSDDDTALETSLRAGNIYHFPYLLKLNEEYKPVSSIDGSDNKLMQFNVGREVSLTANPASGYDFLKWVKPDGAGGWEDVTTANPYVFNIDRDTDLRAVFVHRGIINYTTDGVNYGLMPEQEQTDGQGGFVVADNRGLYAGEGQSLRQWKDALPTHEWYATPEGTGVSNTFAVSTNAVGVATPSEVTTSRAQTGDVVDVYPQFGTNGLELIDVVGRQGATARWQFGKKNGALTMEGAGTTPRIVTQAVITGTQESLDPATGEITPITVTETIDVSMKMQANVNNAGRADEYATVEPGNRYTVPATRGMTLEFAAKSDIEYSIDGGTTFQAYTVPFKYYGNDPELVIALRDASDPAASFEMEYIQATYIQRAQTPVLSMQKVDVWDDDPSDGVQPTNNVQVDVQTTSNPTAVRFYTIDGSEPQYVATAAGVVPKPGTSTRLVRGNYITINESQIQTGTQLKVLSVCPDRPDSKLSILDLEPYDSALALATYVYDSRIINIHEDQIFQKLLREHEGHFNLMSYDLNPNAAKIPELITDHTTVFVTSDKVRSNALDALTNVNNPSSQGQPFLCEPLILGTPLTVQWKQSASVGDWIPITWQDSNQQKTNPATATSPATITYTESMHDMKEQPTRVDGTKTYKGYYADQLAATNGEYLLAFFDDMLHDGSEICISNTTSLDPEDLSYNGTQLVFNATELLTRKTNGVPADVSSFDKMILALMAPTTNPQLTNVKMTYTQDVIDLPADSKEWTTLDAPMLSALSDRFSEMSMPYLAASYPQFSAEALYGVGAVKIINVEVAKAGDITSEKLGAQGVKDLATIIELTHPAKGNDPGDPDFNRTYRVEYIVATEDITFRKEGDRWVCNENDLWTLVEAKDASGQPTYKILGPQNYGIKNVAFNGYAVAPDTYFENGDVIADRRIWGRGEKFDASDTFTCPTAYNVTLPLIPEYSQSSDLAERNPLGGGQWMTSEFPWGFKDCNQMAFTLLNITDYVGDIKVTCYRRQAESPELLSAKVEYKNVTENIQDDMELDEPNGQFVLEFNSVMHEVRKPGVYDSATGQEIVEWTVHVIPEENYPYDRTHPDDFTGVDEKDIPGNRIELYAEGGTTTLRFQYWNLEPGKKYYLHIPFQVLRGAVGTGVPYHLPENLNEPGFDGPEAHMSWTNYPGVPYFDIPFTVKEQKYRHVPFDYIVNNNDWWNAYRSETGAANVPDFAKWDGDFTKGVNQVMALKGTDHEHFYMHVQKKLDEQGKPVAYTYDTGNAGLMQFGEGNFSIVGEDMDNTIITAEPAAYAASDYRGLREDAGGNQTSTIHLDADNVYLQDLTIRNTQEGLNQDGQEYPALFDHGSRNVFYGVNIDAYEESFAVFGTLSYMKNSRISGYGDFVVGSGDVWIDSCNIVLRNRELINLCAPSTKATDKWGFIIKDCDIVREAGAAQVLDHNWTLARPWKGYDTEVEKSPAVTFLNTSIEVLPTNSGYGSLDEGLVLRFHEYGTKHLDGTPISLSTRSIANCMPDPASDAPVLTPEQVAEYTVEKVFGRDNGGYDPEALTRQAKAPVLANDGMVLHWTADPSDLCYLVYYLGDGEEPDWQHAMMFCCVPGTDEEQAYCYLTNHDESPIFRTGSTDKPTSFSELWYGRRKSDAAGADYDGDVIDGMGKESPSRLWFAVRAANQMGGLSPVSNEIMYHAAHQYRTSITSGGKMKGDDTGNAFSTIYLDFQALAPRGVKAYALTGVSSDGGDETAATTLTFTRVNNNNDLQDVVYADQGYLIYGSYGTGMMDHTFIETTAEPTVKRSSYLSGTIGEFKNHVEEQGYGELNGVNDEIGWSINPVDYDDVPRGNVSAYTLQKYNNLLGFYKYTGGNFAHHRAYLDTETAMRVLMGQEGMSEDDAQRQMARGMRIVIQEDEGIEMDITSVLLPASETIYDVTGMQVTRSQMIRGHIYIIDGQKVLWK